MPGRLIEMLEGRRLMSGSPAPLALYDPTEYSAGIDGAFGHANRLTSVDVNGDGRVDLVAGGYRFYRVCLAQSDGTFRLLDPQLFTSSDDVFAIAGGDFNEDGKSDIALACYFGSYEELRVLAGDGTGQFQPLDTEPMPVANDLRTADLNGDGHADLVTENESGVTAFLGKGDGTFTVQARTDLLPDSPDSIVVADMDGDGRLDVVASDFQHSELAILYGDDNGLEGGAQVLPMPDATGTTGIELTAADFNGDGLADIVAIESTFNHLSFFADLGDRTFAPAASSELFPIDSGRNLQWVYDFQSADLNGDGSIDLVYGDSALSELCIRLGNGDGTFQPLQSWAVQSVSTNVNSVAMADFDGDGQTDIASGEFTVWYAGSARLVPQEGQGEDGEVITVGQLQGDAAPGDFQGTVTWDDGQTTPVSFESGGDGLTWIVTTREAVAPAAPAGLRRVSSAMAASLSSVGGTLRVTDKHSGALSSRTRVQQAPAATTASISGALFDDANLSGDRDAGERGVAGRVVYIDANRNGRLDAGETRAVTDAEGNYLFSAMNAGAYRLRVGKVTGLRLAVPSGGSLNVRIGAGQAAVGRDFALTATGKITGRVVKLVPAKGRQPSSQLALKGWRVFIDADNDGVLDKGERSVLTDASGGFSFDGVAAGKYALRVVKHAGWSRTLIGGKYVAAVAAGQVQAAPVFGFKHRI